MARLKGTNVANTTVFGHQHEDGYWLADGYNGHTVVSLELVTVFASVTRTGTGLWQAVLLDAYPCNLNYFHVDPVLVNTSATPLHFVLFNNNVGVAGTTPSTGSTPQFINFGFVNSSGVLTDIAVSSGMNYEIGLRVSTAYYTKNY